MQGSGRIRRLAEELAEEGIVLGSAALLDLLLPELDYALRPTVHERRIPSFGALVAPTVDIDAWEAPTQLRIVRRSMLDVNDERIRRFADGLSSWVVRGSSPGNTLAVPERGLLVPGNGLLVPGNTLIVFDRPIGSERDLMVLAAGARATVVQRHPSGVVRVVGAFGLVRFDGGRWHQEPPLDPWIDRVSAWWLGARTGSTTAARSLLAPLLRFAVHDLGSRGIGAILILRLAGDAGLRVEERLPLPPPLRISRAGDLAPLRHVLSQLDGAALFDGAGTLLRLGMRLVPTPTAETEVEPYRGTRHTAARRYSFDDPDALVVVVSEDGPVSVLHRGALLPPREGAPVVQLEQN